MMLQVFYLQKTFYLNCLKITDFDIIGMLRDPNVVPETKKLIHYWKSSNKIDSFAVAIDEYGEINA